MVLTSVTQRATSIVLAVTGVTVSIVRYSLSMSNEMLSVVRQTVSTVVKTTITRPSDRDMQRSIGPSDIANPCDVCLAEAFRRSVGPREETSSSRGFSLKGWNGTAVHAKLEQDMPLPEDEALCEQRVFIHHIDGYGDIHGHIDLYMPYLGTIVDYKTTDLNKLRNYRLDQEVPIAHQNQLMMYTYGARRAGMKADYAALVYIPRDSNKLDDIWVASAEYHEEIALDSLARAERIWKQVNSADTSELLVHPECWLCNHYKFR